MFLEVLITELFPTPASLPFGRQHGFSHGHQIVSPVEGHDYRTGSSQEELGRGS